MTAHFPENSKYINAHLVLWCVELYSYLYQYTLTTLLGGGYPEFALIILDIHLLTRPSMFSNTETNSMNQNYYYAAILFLQTTNDVNIIPLDRVRFDLLVLNLYRVLLISDCLKWSLS